MFGLSELKQTRVYQEALEDLVSWLDRQGEHPSMV